MVSYRIHFVQCVMKSSQLLVAYRLGCLSLRGQYMKIYLKSKHVGKDWL